MMDVWIKPPQHCSTTVRVFLCFLRDWTNLRKAGEVSEGIDIAGQGTGCSCLKVEQEERTCESWVKRSIQMNWGKTLELLILLD
mmetsp:Transcript_101076/g.205068  ORF Transcript_101076/g.205068 Transcript_101076/m.205068 type:complete len:84 (+) Transcript_101076:1989-2240(+)